MNAWINVAVALDGDYGRGVLRGVASYALKHPDLRVVTSNIRTLGTRPDAPLRRDGLIIQASNPGLIAIAGQQTVPVVNVSNVLPDSSFPRVVNDDAAIGRMAAEHLLEAHLPAYAWSGYDKHLLSRLRFEGFARRLEREGIVVAALPSHPGAREQTVRILAPLPRPIGLFCMNDIRARKLFFLLQEWGYRIPEDVALLGVDNDDLSAWISEIGLSSVKPDAMRVGYLAAERLHHMMQGRPPGPDVEVPPLGIEARGSTDAMGLGDPALRNALQFIRAEATRGIGVDDVARKAGVSRRVLEIRFRQQLNRSVGAEIKRNRLLHGARLLRETPLGVDEIAGLCGYSETSPFSHAFRKQMGLSPRAYRSRVPGVPDPDSHRER